MLRKKRERKKNVWGLLTRERRKRRQRREKSMLRRKKICNKEGKEKKDVRGRKGN